MDFKANAFSGTMLIALLGGATFGAIAVALMTPKSGRGMKENLKACANRLKGRFGELDQYEDEVAMFI